MDKKPIRFRLAGLDEQVSEEYAWPKHLPRPPDGLTIVRMPSSHHPAVGVDRNNDYSNCLPGKERYEWTLADDRYEVSAALRDR